MKTYALFAIISISYLSMSCKGKRVSNDNKDTFQKKISKVNKEEKPLYGLNIFTDDSIFQNSSFRKSEISNEELNLAENLNYVFVMVTNEENVPLELRGEIINDSFMVLKSSQPLYESDMDRSLNLSSSTISKFFSRIFESKKVKNKPTQIQKTKISHPIGFGHGVRDGELITTATQIAEASKAKPIGKDGRILRSEEPVDPSLLQVPPQRTDLNQHSVPLSKRPSRILSQSTSVKQADSPLFSTKIRGDKLSTIYEDAVPLDFRKADGSEVDPKIQKRMRNIEVLQRRQLLRDIKIGIDDIEKKYELNLKNAYVVESTT